MLVFGNSWKVIIRAETKNKMLRCLILLLAFGVRWFPVRFQIVFTNNVQKTVMIDFFKVPNFYTFLGIKGFIEMVPKPDIFNK